VLTPARDGAGGGYDRQERVREHGQDGPPHLLVQDLHVRVINTVTGELIRALTIDLARNYQPTGSWFGADRGLDRGILT
jgi:hypothetical protein